MGSQNLILVLTLVFCFLCFWVSSSFSSGSSILFSGFRVQSSQVLFINFIIALAEEFGFELIELAEDVIEEIEDVIPQVEEWVDVFTGAFKKWGTVVDKWEGKIGKWSPNFNKWNDLIDKLNPF